MKKYIIILVVLMFALSASYKIFSAEKNWGENINKSAIEINKISDLFKNYDEYKDKLVKINGEIESECGDGCWFYLEDESGKMFINLHDAKFSIPQLVKSKVVVFGIASSGQKGVEIIGKRVELEKSMPSSHCH